MLNKQAKKLIAPIIITILIVCFFIFNIYLSCFKDIVMIVISVPIIAISIWMLIERIKEIKGGEEDDLSKY